MQFNSRYGFEADPGRVFDAMTDPSTVAHCLPGCEQLEPLGDNRYQAVMRIGVGAIKGRFKGTVELGSLERPSSYAMKVSGRGPAGFAKGQARVEIEPKGGGSLVSVVAKAQIGGAVARVGQRLLSATAKMVADRFFACLRDRVEADCAGE